MMGLRLFEAIKRVKGKAGLGHEIVQKSQVEELALYSVPRWLSEGGQFLNSVQHFSLKKNPPSKPLFLSKEKPKKYPLEVLVSQSLERDSLPVV
ncbi:MAG: hypothetical protein JHC21_00540 [Thermocrinis sp.]|nr:hypothetical protein [Thermocrinis sp.]